MMELEQALAFVREHSHTILSTTRDDGSAQMSPVNTAVDDDGFLVISTREPALKVRNLRKRPAASLLFLSEGFYGPWIQVDGEVEIVSLPGAMDGLVDYYRRLSGEHPDWDDYRAAMVRDQRVLLRITPRRAGPDHSG